MKAAQYREKSTQELEVALRELKSELFNLRFQQAVGQNNNPMAIHECKRNIARVMTIITERSQKA